LKDLEGRLLEYETAGEFLADDEKTVKVAELKRLEQEGRTIEEFVQEFKRAARGSGYKERHLVEEFKQGINGTIC